MLPVSKLKAKQQAEAAKAKDGQRRRLRGKTQVSAKAAARKKSKWASKWAKKHASAKAAAPKKGKKARAARNEDEVLGKAKVLGREKGKKEKYIVHFCPARGKLRYVGNVTEAQSLKYREICEQVISRV